MCYNCREFGHVSSKCPKKHSPKDCSAIQSNASVFNKDLKVIRFGSTEIVAMIDSGSDINLISEHKYKILDISHLDEKVISFRGIGSRLKSKGCFSTTIGIESDEYETVFHVVDDNLLPYDVILGRELIRQTITILTPDDVIMRKFVPENTVLAIDKGESFNISYIKDSEIKEEIQKMVVRYSSKKYKSKASGIEMRIILTDEKPIAQSPRRLSPLETDIVRQQIKEWLSEAVIQESNSPFASPIVLASKRDGTKRLCVDYRRLNRVIVKDKFPMPLIDDQIDQLQGATIFTTLDLRNGFFHVPVAADSVKYTAFVTPFGHYEFLKTPFGLCNSPAAFQRFINDVFKDLVQRKIVCVYMDDLVIPAKDEIEALLRLKETLAVAEENGLQIKWSKCQFICDNIEYLGYEIERGCVKPSMRKTLAITRFPEPKTLKQVQSFLGLTGYFRRFVENYAIMAKPLSDLLRKEVTFGFHPTHKDAFERLKQALISRPVLIIYSEVAETELHTDACKIGLGAILLQRSSEDSKLHPVFYYSKKTTKCEERYCSYELEVLAIVRALRKFRVYLLGLKFTIVTDCAAFKATMEKRELTSRISGWALQLQEFDFKLEHRPGNRMRHVDSLSRNPVVMVIEDELAARVGAAQREDGDLRPIFKLLESGTYLDYVTNHNLLFKIDQGAQVLVVPRGMQKEVIRNYHEQGHFGVRKVSELVRRNFYIPELEAKVKSCIKNCVTCILSDRKLGKKEGLLNPILKGDTPLATYHVDHMGHLTKTKKQYQYLFTVIDSFSKFVWLYPTKTSTTKEVLQKLELQKSVFGNPAHIVSDRATCFTSADFARYCEDEGIEHSLITAGMPSGNGQVERLNRIIIPALTKLSRDDPDEWYKHVPRLQRYLNNSFQRSIGMAPFELLIGVKMRTPEDLCVKDALEQEMAQNFCEERIDDRKLAKRQIDAVQEENRRTFNKRRKKATTYDVGDMVAIKRTQFVPGSKLQPKFLGPYRVTKVKRGDRYEVEKFGGSVGPRTTSTGAENMKRWLNVNPDMETAYEYESDETSSSEEEIQPSGSAGTAGGPSGKH